MEESNTFKICCFLNHFNDTNLTAFVEILKANSFFKKIRFLYINHIGDNQLVLESVCENICLYNYKSDFEKKYTWEKVQQFCIENPNYKVILWNFPEKDDKVLEWIYYITHFFVYSFDTCVELMNNYDGIQYGENNYFIQSTFFEKPQSECQTITLPFQKIDDSTVQNILNKYLQTSCLNHRDQLEYYIDSDKSSHEKLIAWINILNHLKNQPNNIRKIIWIDETIPFLKVSESDSFEKYLQNYGIELKPIILTIDSLFVEYGCFDENGVHEDITQRAKAYFWSEWDHCFHIKQNTCFNDYFGDVCPNQFKNLKIEYCVNGKHDTVMIEEYRISDFTLYPFQEFKKKYLPHVPEYFYEKLLNSTEPYDTDFMEKINTCLEIQIQDYMEICPFGFIILRHVNSSDSNKYWKECYRCIRVLYDDPIVIIDDNSDPEFLTSDMDITLVNCKIIQSEFPKRGELLPYYYLYKHSLFQKAVILHDSTFIQRKIDFHINQPIRFLLHFYPNEYYSGESLLNTVLEEETEERKLELCAMYDLYNWNGCFGVQSIIDLSFLHTLEKKYHFFKLLHFIDSRDSRMCLERFFGFICTLECRYLIKCPSFFGELDEYLESHNMDKNNNYELYENFKPPIYKVFSGR